MVFIRKIKGYYVMVHPVRKGKRVLQETRYIGKTLPSKERLGQMKKDFLKEVQGQRYKFLSGEEVEGIERRKKEHSEETEKLSELERAKRLKEFMIRFTYDSSKLAGVQVTLRQTSLILKDGIVPKDFKNLRAVKALENHEKGVVAITKYKGKLGIGLLKKLHKVLFSGIDDEVAGNLRNELKRDVKIAGTPYVPPKWQHLKRELDSFFRWYRAENRKMHPLELAALIHLKIISIQPFVDGNSRVARLLMNWILWKKGYPMIDIRADDLENYYNVLDKYQIEHKERPFVKYVVEKYLVG